MRSSGKTVSKRLRNQTCYACPNQATGDDHVPPRFLFPEFKDLGHIYGDLRQGLLTVPACDAHNTEKSGDDSYFVICIAPYIGNNEIAKDHFKTKIRRSLVKDPSVKMWYAQAISRAQGLARNAGDLDRPRLDRTITKIVKGLFNKITGRKILAEKITGILYQDLLDSQFSIFGSRNNSEERLNWHRGTWIRFMAGSPRVFSAEYYADIRNFNRIAFKMQFYEGFRVLASYEGDETDTGKTVPGSAPMPSG